MSLHNKEFWQISRLPNWVNCMRNNYPKWVRLEQKIDQTDGKNEQNQARLHSNSQRHVDIA